MSTTSTPDLTRHRNRIVTHRPAPGRHRAGEEDRLSEKAKMAQVLGIRALKTSRQAMFVHLYSFRRSCGACTCPSRGGGSTHSSARFQPPADSPRVSGHGLVGECLERRCLWGGDCGGSALLALFRTAARPGDQCVCLRPFRICHRSDRRRPCHRRSTCDRPPAIGLAPAAQTWVGAKLGSAPAMGRRQDRHRPWDRRQQRVGARRGIGTSHGFRSWNPRKAGSATAM